MHNLATALRAPSILAAMTLGLVACSSESSTTIVRPGVPAAQTDTCGAAPLQNLIGQPVTMLPAALKGPSLRIIRPGQAVTQDFSPTRINVHVNRSSFITGITCG